MVWRFVFDDDLDGAGDGVVVPVAPGGFGDGWGFVGGGDGPESYEAFFGVAAQFEDKGEVAAEVGDVLAESVEVFGVGVCAVGGAVVAVCEGKEDEEEEVLVEGVCACVGVGAVGGVGGDVGWVGSLLGDGGVGGLGVEGIGAELVHGAGWSWWGEGRLPGFEFEADGAGAGGA